MEVIDKGLDFGVLEHYILHRVEKGLPANLTYHNVAHTKTVLSAAQHLAKAEKVVEKDRQVLEVAALLHDTGFLKTYKAHEDPSCEIARKILPLYGCKSDFIEKVCTLIMATKSPQKPTKKLEQILCDAAFICIAFTMVDALYVLNFNSFLRL